MNLPIEFITNSKEILGNEWNDFERAIQEFPTISLRINENKAKVSLNQENIPWCTSGYYLKERPAFTFDPLFHAGAYYVQEASSMFIEQAVRQLIKGNIIALDLCAAPGGKSTLLLNLLSPDSFLISNEYIRSRAYVLNENIIKWGLPNQMVTNNSSEDFKELEELFDFVLADVPCSGEGMFRKDHQAIEEWSIENINTCVLRQKDIISNIWNSIKPGGYLFYSTCTYNKQENEGVIRYILDNYDASLQALNIKEEWGISISMINNSETYHFYPHKAKGEGFFFAAIRKNGEILNQQKNISGKTKKSKEIKIHAQDWDLRQYLIDEESYFLVNNRNDFFALQKQYETLYKSVKDKLNIVSFGIKLGTLKGKNFIPDQSLAMSVQINENIFPTYNLNWLEALSYLRCEALALNNAPIGIVLLKYQGYNLGFVKNIGNRANNLYPNEWRIRNSNNPDIKPMIF